MEELKNFTSAVLAVKQHKEKYPEVFAELERLENLKDESEEQLKVLARQEGNMDNGVVKVEVIHKWRKWYVPEKVKENKEVYQLLIDNGAVKEEINKTIADKVAKEHEEILPFLQSAYAEEEMTPAVNIKIQI